MVMCKRVLFQVLQGTADANIRFEDLRSLLGALGFTERIRGDAAVVIQEWIENARELGRPIPEPKGRLLFA